MTYVIVTNFLFGNKFPSPNFFFTAGSENVFCFFLNKEVRYWCNSKRFTVLLIWPKVWWQIFFLGKNSHHPIPFTACSENVFCVFLNKEIRHWCNSNTFRVKFMWSMFLFIAQLPNTFLISHSITWLSGLMTYIYQLMVIHV